MSFATHEWVVAATAWDLFLAEHPELAYPSGKFGFHNFLRRYRDVLHEVDALRRAKGRFWIAHKSRFVAAAFECATGRASALSEHTADAARQTVPGNC